MCIINIEDLSSTKELDESEMNKIVGGYSFNFTFMGVKLGLEAEIDGGVVDSTATIDDGKSKQKRRTLNGHGPMNQSEGDWEKV